GRSSDADGLMLAAAAEAAEAAHEAGALGSEGAAEGVGLVEDEIVEARAVEQLGVGGAGEQQLELLDVGEQDPGLLAGGAHLLASDALFVRMDGVVELVLAEAADLGVVVGDAG